MDTDYLQKTLLRLSDKPQDLWTVNDAMAGTSIIGGTGSGKTSGSGKTLAEIFLKEGWGGLVLCAKVDEAELWRNYCRKTGRENDLIIFSKGAVHQSGEYKGQDIVFNPIDYEMKRPGEGAGETQNITNIFMNIYRMGNRIASEGDTHEERYWDTALKRCLNRVIELIKLSGEDLTYKNMAKIVASAHQVKPDFVGDIVNSIKEGKEIAEIEQAQNLCQLLLAKAALNVNPAIDTDEKINSLNSLGDYFMQAFLAMGDKTRSVVTESFMGLAEPFLSGILYNHFSGATNILPEWTYEQNKIIVLDFPVMEYLDAGIIGQCVFKLLFQQAIQRRNVEKSPNPVFLWGDEAHYFVNPYDQLFLTTARSSRTATVFLSQSLSNYLAVMGSGRDAKARVDSLMGNLSTKIFHANSDAETNEYASRLIGNHIRDMRTSGTQQGNMSIDYSRTQSDSEQFLPQVQPREFTVLKSGGSLNEFKVQAVIAVSGRKWSDGKNYLKAEFKQQFDNKNQ